MRTTAPGQSALLLLDVIPALQERHIAYAIIGAFAASFYGVVRASLDADAVISLPKTSAVEELCQYFRGQNLKVEYRRGDSEDPVGAVLNVEDSFCNRVDLLIGIRKMPQEVFQRAQEARFMDTLIKIVSVEDFIALKLFAGSPKDIQDIADVLKVSGKNMDFNLLRKLAGVYGSDCVQKLNRLLEEKI